MSDRGALRRELPMALVLAVVVLILICGGAWALVSTPQGPVLPPVAGGAAPTTESTVTTPLPRSTRVMDAPAPSTSAAIANFNLYGCTESAASWPSCTDRFPRQWDYINRYRLSIVGLQELEPAPYRLFEAEVDAPGSRWAMYPTHPQFVHEQTTGVLWRTDQWRLLEAQEFEIPKYSWRDSGGIHTMDAHEAAVLLGAPSGARLWVLSVHNMSSENADFDAGLARDEAIEADEFASRSGGGVPVVLLGDFNDDTNRPICAVLHATPSAHSIWGRVPAGACTNPTSEHGQPYDKIIASGSVTFTSSGIDWSTQTDKLTDHGIAWVDAVLN